MKFLPKLVLLLLVLGQPGLAQEVTEANTSDVEAEEVTEAKTSDVEAAQQQMDRFKADLAALKTLSVEIETAAAIDREALVYRRDDRNLSVLASLDKLAQQLASLPEGEAHLEKFKGQLTGYMEGTTNIIAPRLDELEQQLAKEQAQLEGLDGLARVSTETYINGLMMVRYRYFEALVQHIETRQYLGHASDGLKKRLATYFYVHAEALAGRLQFVSRALEDLQNRAGEDPENADLTTALGRLGAKQAQHLDRLQNLVVMMERMELDTTAYKSMLVQRGDTVTIDLIERVWWWSW